MTIDVAILDDLDDLDGPPLVLDDPNDCPACVAARELCADHLDAMRDHLAYVVGLLTEIEAERLEALALWDAIEESEAGP